MLLIALLIANFNLIPAPKHQPVIPPPQPRPTTMEIALQVVERMDLLAARHGITWQSAPSVEVGFPNPTPSLIEATRPAVYESESATIWFNPLPYVPESKRTNDHRDALVLLARIDRGLTRTTDHELIHYLFGQECRKLTGHSAPTFVGADSLEQRLGFQLMLEGLANAIERWGEPRPTVSDSLWPTVIDLKLARETPKLIEDLVYVSGYWFMAPLAEKYPLPDLIRFMIQHPLVLNTTNARRSLLRWRHEAQLALSKK